MDASNLLKPPLQKGTLRCIGSTTYKPNKPTSEERNVVHPGPMDPIDGALEKGPGRCVKNIAVDQECALDYQQLERAENAHRI